MDDSPQTQTQIGDAPGGARDAASNTLTLLADMGREFVSTGDLHQSLMFAVTHITDYVDAMGGALFMLDDTGEKLRCDACYGATDITGLEINADQGIVGASVQHNVSEIIRDAQNDPRFHKGVDEQTGFVTQSIICAPLSVKDERIGAIELINKRGDDGLFDDADLSLLSALANSAAMAIVNARMAEQLVEQERLARELELAAEIQRSLLPEGNEGLPIRGINIPARTVSGDFYDYFQLDDGRIVFNLGDVSGKGMNAALLMAKTASLFRCLGKTIDHPGRLMARVNEEICETATRGMFVTMVGGVYDPATGRMRIANAGHEPPLVQSADGEFVELPADAPPLGIMPFMDDDGYPVEDFHLDGGAFYLFTDGVTEGYLADGSELGVDGTKELLNRHRMDDLEGRLKRVISGVEDGGAVLRDDLTILGVDDRAAHAARLEAASRGADVSEDIGSNGEVETVAHIRVPSSPDRLKLVRSVVENGARLAGFTDGVVNDLVLAVDESLQNVIRHAYGGRHDGVMEVTLSRTDGVLSIDVIDEAPPVDISNIKPRDLDDIKPGGLGTHLINEIMDTVDFLPSGGERGNIMRLTKKIG